MENCVLGLKIPQRCATTQPFNSTIQTEQNTLGHKTLGKGPISIQFCSASKCPVKLNRSILFSKYTHTNL